MANQNRLRNKGQQTSYLQERMLDALYILACRDMRSRGVADYVGAVWFKGRAISEVIGGQWTTFRRRHILGLEVHKWMETYQDKTGWHYALTVSGFRNLDDRMLRATAHSMQMFYDAQEDSQQLEMFGEVET